MTALGQFLDAMAHAGMQPTEPHRVDASGELCRFHVDGDRRGTRNGWAVLYADKRPAGAFGHWASGVQGTWSADGTDRLTAGDAAQVRRLIQAARQQRDAERRAGHDAAAVRAQAQWSHTGPADPAHPYLLAKGVGPHGIRQQGIALMIPARDGDGVLWTVETILPDGTKRFMRGGRKAGCWHLLGTVRDRVAICEGYSTAASVFEATGWPVAVAFDAGNMRAVAVALRALHPHADMAIAADNDAVGIAKGREAAAAARARLAVARMENENGS